MKATLFILCLVIGAALSAEIAGMLEDEGPVEPDQLGKLTEDDDDDQLDNEDPTGPDQFIADVAPIDETTTEDQEIEEFELKRAPDEVDDPVVVDGDILLSKEQAAIYKESGWDGLVKSAVWSKRTRRWGRIIPYYIHPAIKRKAPGVYKNTISSIREINRRQSCVLLRRWRRGDRRYLYIQLGRGCYTWLGAPSIRGRSIYLAHSCAGTSRRKMTPAHEIMHTMGRFHEQTRPDRDRFVRINPRNTCPSQMKKNSAALTTVFGITYDYESVMHYSRWQCARKVGSSYQPSMSYPRWINPNEVGQRKELSDLDVLHIVARSCIR